MDPLEPEEKSLWQEALDNVVPIAKSRHRRPVVNRIARAKNFAADEAQVMPEAMEQYIEPEDFEAGDETEFRADGVSRQQARKLRRGQFAIQAQIDLHGKTRPEAAEAVRALLQQAEARDWRCVKIIHGKGLRSPNGQPVLKSRVETALRRSNRVLAYATAPPWSGGHGALLVLLRARTA